MKRNGERSYDVRQTMIYATTNVLRDNLETQEEKSYSVLPKEKHVHEHSDLI